MHKCIILDGPDCTGKSTLASKLSEAYNIPIYHLTYYEDPIKHNEQFNKMNHKIGVFNDNINAEGFILDRYVFSEIVYKNVYRPDQPVTYPVDEYMWGNLYRGIMTGNVEVIFTLPEDRERWFEMFKVIEQERKEMYTSEKMYEVYDNYLDFWNKWCYNRNVSRYDFFKNMDGYNKGKVIEL